VAPNAGTVLKTWEYPKKSGIRIREVLNANGGERFGASYLVTIPAKITGKLRERKQFKDKAEAEKCANDTIKGCQLQGQEFFALSDQERREVSVSLPELRKHGVSVVEAVRFSLKHLRPEGRTKTFRAVVDEIVASKAQRFQRSDLRERSYQDFKQRAEKIAANFEGRIASEISINEIKEWVTGLGIGVRSNKNYLATLGEIFKLATQRRYIAFSPLDELTDMDRKELCGGGPIEKEPNILTPDQAEKLLVAALAHPELDLIGAVTLGLFCGVRTEEIKRLDWNSVKISETEPVVTIGIKIAKKRRIRHVEIPKNAVLWLSLVAKDSGPVARNDHANHYQKRFKKLLGFAKFKKWEGNAMRHSFGSYHYALHGNPLETSRLLGHKVSDQVLFDHYRALATKAQAEAYFAIRPKAERSKLIKFTG
jgi:integrase